MSGLRGSTAMWPLSQPPTSYQSRRTDPGRRRAAGDADRRVVLLGAVDPVGKLVVHRDAVGLDGGLVGLGRPALAAVIADVGAAVVAVDHHLGVVGVDPQVMVVAVGRPDELELLAAVGRAPHPHVENVDGLGVSRVGEDVRVVPGALPEVAVVVDQAESVASVVGAEQPAILGLDQGPDPARPGRRNGHADAALDAVGQSLGQFLPGVAAVHRAVEPALRLRR